MVARKLVLKGEERLRFWLVSGREGGGGGGGVNVVKMTINSILTKYKVGQFIISLFKFLHLI